MITESEIDELFRQTLAGDYDDDLPWQAVSALHTHGNRAIFDRALQWSSSPDPLKRARAADIIAQLAALPPTASHSFQTNPFPP